MRFNVNNFLSFKEIQEFSMIKTAVRKNPHHLIKGDEVSLLKLATMYGANAAGKSNLIKAMDTSQKIILNGLNKSNKNKYYKLEKKYELEETLFEYEIKINNKFYAYGFKCILSELKITAEWLYEISKSKQEYIFERDVLNKDYRIQPFNDLAIDDRLNIYLDDMKTNMEFLFLKDINRNKLLFEKHTELLVFQDVYRWFEEVLTIVFPDTALPHLDFLITENEEEQQKLFQLMDVFNTGITDIEFVEKSTDEFKSFISKTLLDEIERKLDNSKTSKHIIRTNKNYQLVELDEDGELQVKDIVFKHGNLNCIFDFYEESDGTRRLFDLLSVLITNKEKVYIIDELDRSLHPNLTYKFIELFLDLCQGQLNQLIITTHEDRIIDLNLLRRDEIWFVEKRAQGDSIIYSLDSFGNQFDKRVCEAYLEGRFGAIPKFKRYSPLFREER